MVQGRMSQLDRGRSFDNVYLFFQRSYVGKMKIGHTVVKSHVGWYMLLDHPAGLNNSVASYVTSTG